MSVYIPCILRTSGHRSEIRMLYLRIHDTKRLFHQILCDQIKKKRQCKLITWNFFNKNAIK